MIMYMAMNLPIAIWMLRSFFEEVPRTCSTPPGSTAPGVREMTRDPAADGRSRDRGDHVHLDHLRLERVLLRGQSGGDREAATVPLFMEKFVTSEGLFWAKLAAASTMAMRRSSSSAGSRRRQLVRGSRWAR